MLDIKDLSIETKSSAGFGIIALILSLLLGIIFGVNFSTVLIRSIILTALFAGLGFAVITVIKRFVPELYEAFRGAGLNSYEGEGSLSDDQDGAPMNEDITSSGMNDEAGGSEMSDADGKGQEFSELSKGDFPKFDSVGDTGLDSGNQNLGKHIISDEKVVTYEPKIMAQAIRTMIAKDED